MMSYGKFLLLYNRPCRSRLCGHCHSLWPRIEDESTPPERKATERHIGHHLHFNYTPERFQNFLAPVVFALIGFNIVKRKVPPFIYNELAILPFQIMAGGSLKISLNVVCGSGVQRKR